MTNPNTEQTNWQAVGVRKTWMMTNRSLSAFKELLLLMMCYLYHLVGVAALVQGWQQCKARQQCQMGVHWWRNREPHIVLSLWVPLFRICEPDHWKGRVYCKWHRAKKRKSTHNFVIFYFHVTCNGLPSQFLQYRWLKSGITNTRNRCPRTKEISAKIIKKSYQFWIL